MPFDFARSCNSTAIDIEYLSTTVAEFGMRDEG